MTSDDRAFFTNHQADSYGQTLPDRKVDEYTRQVTEHFQEGVKEPIAVTETIDQTTVETKEKTSEGDAADKAPADGSTAEGSGETGSDEPGQTESGDAGSDLSPEQERAEVAVKYLEVFGKKPSNFMKVETMQAKISEALASK